MPQTIIYQRQGLPRLCIKPPTRSDEEICKMFLKNLKYLTEIWVKISSYPTPRIKSSKTFLWKWLLKIRMSVCSRVTISSWSRWSVLEPQVAPSPEMEPSCYVQNFSKGTNKAVKIKKMNRCYILVVSSEDKGSLSMSMTLSFMWPCLLMTQDQLMLLLGVF